MNTIANIILTAQVTTLTVHKITTLADSDFWIPLLVFAAFILLIYMALSTHKLKKN